jgi:hypothetical protein
MNYLQPPAGFRVELDGTSSPDEWSAVFGARNGRTAPCSLEEPL